MLQKALAQMPIQPSKNNHQRRGKGLFFGGQIGRCDEGKPCWFKKEARVPILWGFMV